MFNIIRRLSLLLLLLALIIPMFNLRSSTARAASSDTSTAHAVRLASPAVVRIITLLEGRVTVAGAAQNGGDLTFPLDGSYYYLATSGSGVFVSPDGYILTANHVVDYTKHDQNIGWAYVQMAADEYAKAAGITQQEAIDDFTRLANAGKVSAPYKEASQKAFLPTTYTGELQNVAQVTSYEVTRIVASSPVDKQDVAIIKIEAHDMPYLTLASASSIQVQDSITSVAFPSDADMDPTFGQLLDPTRSEVNTLNGLLIPSVETGQVTAEKHLSDGTLVYQTSNIASYGSSGGPVINGQGQIVGFIDASSTSQRVVFLIPGDVITSYLKQAGIANPEKGAFMVLWTKAINEYDGTQSCHWTNALHDLQRLHNDYPAFGAVQTFLRTAESKATPSECPASPSPSGVSPWLFVGIGGGLLIILAAVGVLVFVLRRRRHALQPIGYATGATPPSPVPGGVQASAASSGALLSGEPVSGKPASVAQKTEVASSAFPPIQERPAEAVASPALPTRKCIAGHVITEPNAHFCPECGAPVEGEPLHVAKR